MFGSESFIQVHSKRTLLEQNLMSKSSFLISVGNLSASKVNKTNSPVEKYLPEEKAIVLENGKKYTYDFLLIGTGVGRDFNSVEGLH